MIELGKDIIQIIIRYLNNKEINNLAKTCRYFYILYGQKKRCHSKIFADFDEINRFLDEDNKIDLSLSDIDYGTDLIAINVYDDLGHNFARQFSHYVSRDHLDYEFQTLSPKQCRLLDINEGGCIEFIYGTFYKTL